MNTGKGKQYRDQLFSDLAIECNTVDVQTTKQFYYGLIKLIEKRLKSQLFIELPDLARFEMYNHKGRRYNDVNTNKIRYLEPHKALKVKANHTLRKKIRDYYKDEG